MSDDEEIIYKGKSLGLYNYLTELGYVDFETFEPDLIKQESFSLLHDHPLDKHKEELDNAVSKPTKGKVTYHDYRKVVAILRSQLLVKEDAEIVESLLHNKHVCNQRPNNYIFHTSVVLTGVLSSVVMLRSKVNFGLAPAVLTLLFSCYSAWQFYKEFHEDRKGHMFMTHISVLKKLSFNILKLTRFIKETEILSTGQVPINNVGTVLYVPSAKHKLKDKKDVSSQRETLPHLRKCLLDTVEEGLNTLIVSVNSLRQHFFERELLTNSLIFLHGDNLEPFQSSEEHSCCVTLIDLKEVTRKFLCVQSEYLKELAFIFSSMPLKVTVSRLGQEFKRDEMFEMFGVLNKKLTDISLKLMMQYNIHNTASTFKEVTSKSSSRHHSRELNDLQNSVHNIFLLLYSALLRVRSLEDTLENLSEIGESLKMKDELPVSLDVTEPMTVLKDDLLSTVRCYDVLCQQITGQSQKQVEITDEDSEGEGNVTEVHIKETGIVVGTSDFTINSPDEVFLSLSGIINNEEISSSEIVGDWSLERKPQIPKSLLTELSQTLKSRKVNFIEREKDALKRKGLQDIDNLSSSNESSDETEDSFSRKPDKSSFNYKRHIAAQDFSHSSDSDDEMDPFEKGAFLTKLKTIKKFQSEPYSDSDSSFSYELSNKTICGSEVACNPIVSTYSVANLAASKSQMWGKNIEDYYSDGSES